MRKLILATAASVAITAASLLPIGGGQAMTPGTASGVRAAIAQTSPIESVRCWRPCVGCRLVCRGGYYRGYYGGGYGPGYYGGYPGYYGGYGPGYYGGYGPGVGVYGPGVGIGIGVGPRWGW
jgi:hypothetical protein